MAARSFSIAAAPPMPFIITLQPCAANTRAKASPMPPVEPVTSAVFPLNAFSIDSSGIGTRPSIVCSVTVQERPARRHMVRSGRAFGCAFSFLGFLAGLPASADAAGAGDAYPVRPIRWIVPAPPGGGTDAVSRIMAPKLTEILKQQIVVDNRGGVQGSIATALVAKAPPDGYTILFTFSGPIAVNPHIFREVGYDALKDFAGLTRYTQQPMVMTAHPSLPVSSLKELAAYAGQNPGKVTFASSASLQHLGGELFKLAAGV